MFLLFLLIQQQYGYVFHHCAASMLVRNEFFVVSLPKRLANQHLLVRNELSLSLGRQSILLDRAKRVFVTSLPERDAILLYIRRREATASYSRTRSGYGWLENALGLHGLLA